MISTISNELNLCTLLFSFNEDLLYLYLKIGKNNNIIIQQIDDILNKRKVYFLCLPLNSALGLIAPDRSLTTDDRRHRTKARPKLSSVRRRRGNVGQICTACPTCPCRKTASHIPTPTCTGRSNTVLESHYKYSTQTYRSLRT